VLVAMVEKENIKCQRVLTKLGFKYQHDIELYGYVFELFKITSPAVI
jgi:RimJ/RimL family protein N-acetyltransferase